MLRRKIRQTALKPVSQSVVAMGLLALMGAAPSPSVEEQWRAGLAEANVGWAKAPHAILKIQDAAYLSDGQDATLVGTRGQPQSYHWIAGVKPGALWASFRMGHLISSLGGKSVGEALLKSGVPVDAGIDVQAFPTQVSAGVIGVRIMLYNQTRKEAQDFRGVDYFPYDPSYRISAAFKPDRALPPRVFRTSRGTDKQFFHAGDATFVLAGKQFTLPFYTSDPKKVPDMSSFFMDDQAGHETYGAGRYVDVEPFGAFPPKTVTIDFNNAYNPNCSRSAFYTCPIATDRIAMAIKAGERNPHMAH